MGLDWTEEEENALLDYLRDKSNNKRFWKRNTEREKAFGDCAIFLSKQSERKRHFEAEDVKNFCLYLVEERYALDKSNLSHLFRTGIFFNRDDGRKCDIWTREECRKFAEEDKAREEGQSVSEEATALPLRISESESITRRGARYKSRSSEVDDGKNSSKNARKRRKSQHPKSVEECPSLPMPEGQKDIPTLPEGANHLVYKHRHMDGAEIRRKFKELEKQIVIAADSLSPTKPPKISCSRMYRYGPDDLRLIKSIPIASMIKCREPGAYFQTARALIGLSIYQWVFGDEIADSEMYGHPSREAVEAVWNVKCLQHDMRILNPVYAVLKDAYFWQTTQAKFLDVLLPKRARDLSGRLVSLLGTLFKIEVPQCSKEHDIEQARRKDCDSWSCQVEAIFFDALDLHVRLKQRDHKTIFRWPAVDDEFDGIFMQNEEESIANQRPNLVVRITYMPAVIDEHDSEDPSAVERGVWYKALVRVATAADTGQVPVGHNQGGCS